MQNVDGCVSELVGKFPIEDIWVLDAAKANECGLDGRLQLLAFVGEGSESHLVEEEIGHFVSERFSGFQVHVFSVSALYQTPRPLLVKMAFTSGRKVFGADSLR